MQAENQEPDDEATRWLDERNQALIGELAELLDVEAGLTSIINSPNVT